MRNVLNREVLLGLDGSAGSARWSRRPSGPTWSCGDVFDREVLGQALCHLPSEKPGEDEQHLGDQVGERGLDLLLGPGGIALLQGVKGEARIVVDERDFGVALRRLPDGAVQEDADRVDAQRRHQSLPQRDQFLLVQG